MLTDINYEETREYESMFFNEQVNSLKALIGELQDEVEIKDKIVTVLKKDKETLYSDIKKLKRSNLNLKQQLEDERDIYLKEKEYYNKEMSEHKFMRKKQMEEYKNIEEIVEQNKEIENLKVRISEINNALHNTLQANYNLSIKFLRMKNTKYSLKSKLKREQIENSKIINYLIDSLDHVREEINHIISEKFSQIIPPSNKKYLQVVKQNTQLLFDNLNYQLQLSKLHNVIENIKADNIKYETKLKLRYTRDRFSKSRKNTQNTHAANFCNTEPQHISTIIKDLEHTHAFADDAKSLNSLQDNKLARRTHSVPEIIRSM